MKLQILGCGTSTGVPIPGCRCSVCTSSNPKNWRNRTSAVIRINEHENILIDATTDLRQQALKWDVRKLNAVLFTHAHADHILGTDDLRAFNFSMKSRIPCYATKETFDVLRHLFSYIFEPDPNYQGGMLAQLDIHEIESQDTLDICGVKIQCLPLLHGDMSVLGFRIGNVAYATDCNKITPEAEEALEGVEYLVLDALRHKPHATHFSTSQAIEVAQKVGAKQTWFVHMTHDLDYDETNAGLPDGIELAYDGLEIPITIKNSEKNI